MAVLHFLFLALFQSTQQLSQRAGEQSKQPKERKGKQSKQLSEPETPDDIFSLLAEVQEWRKVVSGLERQPKQHEGEPAKQPTRREGGQSKQPSKQESADDMFSLLAEIKELTEIAIERKRQKKEDQTLKQMIEDTKEMNIQIQQLTKR